MTPLLEAFSSALLHFAWQGCLVLAFLWVTLFLLRKRSANARYAAACMALALLAAAPLLTTSFLFYSRATGHPLPAGMDAAPSPVIAFTPPVITHPPAVLAAARLWALPAWACGVFLFSLRMVWGCAQVALLRRRGEAAGDAVVCMVSILSRRMGLVRQARVLVSAWAGGPSLVGWLRPVILLPASAISGLTPKQLEAVLAHELAHIRRHDYLMNWMQMLVETLLFYHPAVWWVSSRIRHERELCCDDLAVSICDGAVCYARALSKLEKMRAAAPVPVLGSMDGALLYRIQRIVGAATREYGPSRASIVVALSLSVAGMFFSVNWARGQSQPAAGLLAEGDALLRNGSIDLALQKYLAGSATDALNRPTYQKRCIEAYMRMGRKAEAAEVNAQLLKEQPDDTDGLAFGATILLDQGNAAGAIAQLQRVLVRVPENPVAHFDLGRAYAVQGNMAGARSEIEQAIALRPDFTRARQELERLGQTPAGDAQPGDDELALLQAQSARSPERLDLLRLLGNAAARAGKYDLAIYAFQKLLDRTESNAVDRADIYLRLGETYRRKGDPAAAIQALERARELAPGNRFVIGPLMWALEATGRHSEATQLRQEFESTQSNRMSLVAGFLNDELKSAETRLEALRKGPNPDVEVIRKAEFELFDLRRRAAASMVLEQPVGRVLESIFVAGITEARRRELHLPVHVGDLLSIDTVGATNSAVKIFDPSIDVKFIVLENGRVRLVIEKPSN